MSFGRDGLLWRNMGLPLRLGPIDGRALIFVVVALFHWAIWTFALAFVGILALFMIDRAGYTVPNMVRRLQVLLMGPVRPHQSARRLRSDL